MNFVFWRVDSVTEKVAYDCCVFTLMESSWSGHHWVMLSASDKRMTLLLDKQVTLVLPLISAILLYWLQEVCTFFEHHSQLEQPARGCDHSSHLKSVLNPDDTDGYNSPHSDVPLTLFFFSCMLPGQKRKMFLLHFLNIFWWKQQDVCHVLVQSFCRCNLKRYVW